MEYVRKTLNLFLIVTFLFSFVVFSSEETKAESIGDWSNYRSLMISHVGSLLINYQVMLRVGESSGSTGCQTNCGLPGNVRSDFSDLRFVTPEGVFCDYWIESKVGTTPNQVAIVWIEIPVIAADVNTTINMYYGNPGVASASNGSNTFLFFDDFLGSSLDSNKWTSYISRPAPSDASCNVTVSGGVMTMYNSATNSPVEVVGKQTFVNKAVRSRILTQTGEVPYHQPCYCCYWEELAGHPCSVNPDAYPCPQSPEFHGCPSGYPYILHRDGHTGSYADEWGWAGPVISCGTDNVSYSRILMRVYNSPVLEHLEEYFDVKAIPPGKTGLINGASFSDYVDARIYPLQYDCGTQKSKQFLPETSLNEFRKEWMITDLLWGSEETKFSRETVSSKIKFSSQSTLTQTPMFVYFKNYSFMSLPLKVDWVLVRNCEEIEPEFLSDYPSVVTKEATNVTWRTVTMNGSLSNPGGVNKMIFRYGFSSDYDKNDQTTEEVTIGGGDFHKDFLSASLKTGSYHYRVEGTIDGNWVVGEDREFVIVPSIETSSAVTSCEGAILRGNLLVSGSNNRVRFRWGRGSSSSYSEETEWMTVPSAGEFSSSLIPAIVLSQGTYHYAAEMIIDGSNPSMGEDVIFVMAGPSSNFSIKTLPADNVTAVGAVLNGEITIK